MPASYNCMQLLHCRSNSHLTLSE